MNKANLLKKAKAILINEEQKVLFFKDILKKQELSIKNHKLFRLLSRINKTEQRIKTTRVLIKEIRRQLRYDFVITFTSKVKLISTKVGAIMWVDANNYLQLVGKKVGDIVTMHNSQFMVAGIY